MKSGEGMLELLKNFFIGFKFKASRYKKYYGDDVELLKRIEYLIQDGGSVHLNRKEKLALQLTK